MGFVIGGVKSMWGAGAGAWTGAMVMWSAGLGALAGGWMTSWPEQSEHPQMLARTPPVMPQNAPDRVFIAVLCRLPRPLSPSRVPMSREKQEGIIGAPTHPSGAAGCWRADWA